MDIVINIEFLERLGVDSEFVQLLKQLDEMEEARDTDFSSAFIDDIFQRALNQKELEIMDVAERRFGIAIDYEGIKEYHLRLV